MNVDGRIKLPLLVVVLCVLPMFVLGSSYYVRMLDHFLLFAMFAIALNLVFGHTDQLFLFVGGLAGVGAYTTAILANMFGLPIALTLIAGVALAGVIGGVVSWISARLRLTVVLISILTLCLQLALHEFFVGARSITGGSTGFFFSGFDLEAIAQLVGVNSNLVLYYLLVVLVVVWLLVYSRLVNSKYGLAFKAIREDELAAESIGVDVVRYKTVAGVVAAMMIGLTGVLVAEHNHYVIPELFSFTGVDVVVLIMLFVGGMRTTYGPIYGAAIITGLEEVLIWLAGWQTASDAAIMVLLEDVLNGLVAWQNAIFGALLIVLFLYFRQGVIPKVVGWFQELRERFRSDGSSGDKSNGGPR